MNIEKLVLLTPGSVLPRLHYLLEPILSDNVDKEEVTSIHDSLIQKHLEGGKDATFYIIWALKHIANVDHHLQGLLHEPFPEDWMPTNPRILLRLLMVKIDKNEHFLRDTSLYKRFISFIVGEYKDLGSVDNYSYENHENRMNVFRYLEEQEIISLSDISKLIDILGKLNLNILKKQINEEFETLLKCSKSDINARGDAVLTKAARVLRKVYKSMQDIPASDFFSPWPKLDHTHYVTLTCGLVSNHSFTSDDDFTLRKSADGIPNHKYSSSVEYSQVFPKDLQPLSSIILVSGRPGIGKTVLLTKIAKDWAKGECLGNIEILFHISLSELASRTDFPELEDIIGMFYTSSDHIEAVTEAIEKVSGEGVCFALDGLDEYSNCTSHTDFIMCLLKKIELSLSTVIITTRPDALMYVPLAVRQKHVEIVGFMPEQILGYIKNYYESIKEPYKAQALINYLEVHPNVKDMCYLPLHLAMILYINQFRGTDPLPETETEIFLRFVTHSVIRYIKRQKKDEYIYIRHFKDMEEILSKEELELFHMICLIAFKMKASSRFIFDESHLEDDLKFGQEKYQKLAKNGLGILSNYRNKVEGEMPQFSFQHLTIQEFLGAYHLTLLEDPLFYISTYGGSSDMRELWKFFVGLTKDSDFFVNCYNKLLELNPKTGSDTLFLVRCLFEAQNGKHIFEGCEALLESQVGTINVSNIVLNSPDCSAIGYVISQCPEKLRQLLMNYCEVGPDGIVALKNQITKADHIRFDNIWNMQIRSQLNPLGDKGGTHLAEILKRMTKLCELRLYGNKLTNDKLLPLQPLISSMTNLRILVLTRNNLGLNAGSTIGLILENLCHLKQFYMSYNPISTEGLRQIIPGLLRCRILERLGLRGCNLNGESGKLLNTIVLELNCLQRLELYLNHLGDNGVANMIEGLKATTSLQEVSFTKNDITDIGGCLLSEVVKVNKSLKEMRLFYNEVTYETRMAFYDATMHRMNSELSDLRYAI